MAQMTCPNCGKNFEEFQFKDHSCEKVHCPGCGGDTANCNHPQFKVGLGQEEIVTVGERIFNLAIACMFLGLPLLSSTERDRIFNGKTRRQHIFPICFDNNCTPCGYKWNWVVGNPKPQGSPQPELVTKREAYEKRVAWETARNATAYSGTGANKKEIGYITNGGTIIFMVPSDAVCCEISQYASDNGTIYPQGRFFGNPVGQVSNDGIVYSISGGIKKAVGDVDKDGTIFFGTGIHKRAVGLVEPPSHMRFGGATLILCLIPMIEKQRQTEYENDQYEQGRAHQMAEDAARRAGWR